MDGAPRLAAPSRDEQQVQGDRAGSKRSVVGPPEEVPVSCPRDGQRASGPATEICVPSAQRMRLRSVTKRSDCRMNRYGARHA